MVLLASRVLSAQGSLSPKASPKYLYIRRATTRINQNLAYRLLSSELGSCLLLEEGDYAWEAADKEEATL